MIENNFVIFRNYSVRGYWEISGSLYTTYLHHDALLSSEGPELIETMMYLHRIKDIKEITETMTKYTQDPQEDMFIVEIN
jgi:hypothetical protein